MPNWCQNKLTVTGPDLDSFLTALGVKDGSEEINILETLVPMPEILRGTVSGGWLDTEEEAHQEQARAETGYPDWYAWQQANWGIKWGDCHTFMSSGMNDDEDVVLHFDSAWSPPVDGICKVSAIFPTLTFVLGFSESGMVFVGAVRIVNGEVVTEETGTYPDPPEDFDDEAQWEAYADAEMYELDRCMASV
jgi:hypothetical protein